MEESDTIFSDAFFASYRTSEKPDHHHHQYPYSSRRPARPPLTAIDRFLSGQVSHLSNNGRLGPENIINNIDDGFSSVINEHVNGAISTGCGDSSAWTISQLDHEEDSFFDGICVDHINHDYGTVLIEDERIPNIGIGDMCPNPREEQVELLDGKDHHEMIMRKMISTTRAKKASSNNSVALIKGQWTDEEDRCVCIYVYIVIWFCILYDFF